MTHGIAKSEARKIVVKTGIAVMTATIVKSGITRAEETVGAKERRSRSSTSMAKIKGHWTNECPFARTSKEEFDRQHAQPAKPVNYTSHQPQQ